MEPDTTNTIETTPTTAERIARLLEIGRQVAALTTERAALLAEIDTDDPDVTALAAALGLRRKSGRKPGSTARKPAVARKRGAKPPATEPAPEQK